MMDERGASMEFQQDQVDDAERRVGARLDQELARMIRAITGLVAGSAAYTDEVVAIVRRHTAELRADLGRKHILIDHLMALDDQRAAREGRRP